MGDLILSDNLIKKIAKETATILKNDKAFDPSVYAAALENGSIPKNIPSQTMLTTDDVIAQSGLSIQIIRRHIHKGLLKGNKIGKRYFFTQQNINEYLNTNKDHE